MGGPMGMGMGMMRPPFPGPHFPGGPGGPMGMGPMGMGHPGMMRPPFPGPQGWLCLLPHPNAQHRSMLLSSSGRIWLDDSPVVCCVTAQDLSA